MSSWAHELMSSWAHELMSSYLAACLGRDGIPNVDRFDFRYFIGYRKSNRSTLRMPSLPRQAARYTARSWKTYNNSIMSFMSSWALELMSSWAHELMSSWAHELIKSSHELSWAHELLELMRAHESSWELMSSWAHEFIWYQQVINSFVEQ